MKIESTGWVLACDIDDTLVPTGSRSNAERAAGNAALATLCTVIGEARAQSDMPIYFGSVTGRTIASHTEYEDETPALAAAVSAMDFKVTSVGAESHIRTPSGFERISDWPQTTGWNRSKVSQALLGYPDLRLQPDIAQGDYKVSFDVEGETDDHDAYVATIAARLAKEGLAAHIVFSGGVYLDILPQGVDKGSGLLHTVRSLSPARPYIIAADDSMNGRDLLRAADMAILPGNAHDSLRRWAKAALPPEKLYIAKAAFAAGILEGINNSGLPVRP